MAGETEREQMNKAEMIVDDILKNLRDRRGIGDELELIEPDIYDEMRWELTDIVQKHLE